MTLILKSNQAVVDPDNKFPILTDLGEATFNVANYKDRIELAGGVLTQGEFDALNILDKGLSNLGVQNSVLEMNLALGNNLNSKLVKFKGWKSNTLDLKNSFDSTNIDSKGFIWNTVQGGGAKALGLGFTIQDVYNLPKGLHSILYFKYNSAGTNPNEVSHLLGAGNANVLDENYYGIPMIVGNGQVSYRVLNAALVTNGFDARSTSILLSSLFSWDNTKKTSYRGIYQSQNKIVDSLSSVEVVSGTAMSKEVYLGANNGDVTVYNFYGQIGVAVFLDGSLTPSTVLSVSDLINNFIIASNKNY